MIKSFINERCYDAIRNLTPEQKGILLDSIFEYVLYGNVKDCEPIVSMAFGFIKAEIDSCNERARIISQKRSDAGKKGGRPRLEPAENDESKQKQKKQLLNLLSKDFPSPLPLSSPLEENASPTPPDKEDNPPIIPLSFPQEKTTNDANASLSTCVDADADIVIDFNSLVKFFNNTMEKGSALISNIRDIKGNRMTMVKARAREYGKGSIMTVIQKAAVSLFLNGGGNTGFVASFDWLMRPNNFIKVLEGNYDNKQPINNQANGTSRQPNQSEQRAAEAAAVVARLLETNRPAEE